MAKKPTDEQLQKFYQKCLANGCTNMNDNRQKLMAKGLASEMGLKVGVIETMVAEARECYQAEKERERKRAEAPRKQADSLREAGDVLMVTLHCKEEMDSDTDKIEIYRKNNGRMYSVVHGFRAVKGVPILRVTENKVIGYDGKFKPSGRAYIEVLLDHETKKLHHFVPSEGVHTQFMRNFLYRKCQKNGVVFCQDTSGEARRTINSAVRGGLPSHLQTELYSLGVDKQYLGYRECKTAHMLLDLILKNTVAASREERLDKERRTKSGLIALGVVLAILIGAFTAFVLNYQSECRAAIQQQLAGSYWEGDGRTLEFSADGTTCTMNRGYFDLSGKSPNYTTYNCRIGFDDFFYAQLVLTKQGSSTIRKDISHDMQGDYEIDFIILGTSDILERVR